MTAVLIRRWQRWNIKVLMALVALAVYHNSLRVRTYLLRAVLVPPSLSPWRKLYDEGDSSSFLHVTGIDTRGFRPTSRRCYSSRSQDLPATQGEAVVTSTRWDVGAVALLSG